VPEVRIVYVGIGEEAGLGAEFLRGASAGPPRERSECLPDTAFPPKRPDTSALQCQDLRRGESHDSVGGIVAKADVEIMKVAVPRPRG